MPVKLIMTSCQSATDMIAMHGVDKHLFRDFREDEVDDSAVERFVSDRSGALVGNRIASRYGWKDGDPVTLNELDGISFTISGIFTTNGGPDDFLILTDRDFLQQAAGEQGISNHVLVKLNEGADPGETSQTIDGLPLTVDTNTQPERVHLSAALDHLSDLVAVSKIVIIGIIGVILIAIGNAISMVMRDRSAEFGIMRTLGFGKQAIMALVMGEGLLQAVIGGVLGCAIVEVLIRGGLVKTVSTCGFSVTFLAGPQVWVISILAVVFAAAAGSILPAWRIANLDIVTAIRRED